MELGVLREKASMTSPSSGQAHPYVIDACWVEHEYSTPIFGGYCHAHSGGAMTRSERASQIWAVLAWAARNRQSLTYSQVSALIGVPRAGLGQLLEPIQSYCMVHGLPPLTVLVVQQESGMPGSGFTGASAGDLAKAQMGVFAEDWLARRNPNPEALEEAALKISSAA